MINSLIRDIARDPREYSPFLLMVGAVLLFWAGLSLSGLVALRARTPRRRFGFALPPLLLGAVCVLAKIPISIEADGSRWSFDLRWLFLVPLLLGVAGLAIWWRARRAAAL